MPSRHIVHSDLEGDRLGSADGTVPALHEGRSFLALSVRDLQGHFPSRTVHYVFRGVFPSDPVHCRHASPLPTARHAQPLCPPRRRRLRRRARRQDDAHGQPHGEHGRVRRHPLVPQTNKLRQSADALHSVHCAAVQADDCCRSIEGGDEPFLWLAAADGHPPFPDIVQGAFVPILPPQRHAVCLSPRTRCFIIRRTGISSIGDFFDYYDPTIEDYYRKLVEVDKKPAMLDIMDTAGQSEFASMQDTFYRQGKGFLVVYAIDKPHTFEYARNLRKKIVQSRDDEEPFALLLVGNKCDLDADGKRKVPKQSGIQLAKEWECPFLETSAKQEVNHKKAFETLVREIRKVYKYDEDGTNRKEPKSGRFGWCTLL